MAPRKLTEADKAAILGLYRQPEETTSTLADRYGVSNSTISRLLKASLPEADYKILIQQKRSTADRGTDLPSGAVEKAATPQVKSPAAERPEVETSAPEVSPAQEPLVEIPTAVTEAAPARDPGKAPPILKKRASTASPAPTQVPSPTTEAATILPEAEPEADTLPVAKASPNRRRSRSRQDDEAEATQLSLEAETPVVKAAGPSRPAAPTPANFDPAEAEDEDEAWAETAAALGEDYDEDDEDDEDDDDEDVWDVSTPGLSPQLEAVEIYPLTPSDLPVPCYLVVERISSELVALPLKTFASLGQIPEEEGDLRTLPVFDNHRIARRFSRRNQRVIKVPDGTLLQTTSPYLQAKGITRLLIDGQVFSLDQRTEAEPVGATP